MLRSVDAEVHGQRAARALVVPVHVDPRALRTGGPHELARLVDLWRAVRITERAALIAVARHPRGEDRAARPQEARRRPDACAGLSSAKCTARRTSTLSNGFSRGLRKW